MLPLRLAARRYSQSPPSTRAGIVYQFRHIDIGPPPLPHDPAKKNVHINSNGGNVKFYSFTFNPTSKFFVLTTIALLGLLEVGWKFHQLYSESMESLKVVQRIAGDAPDLETLDDNALTTHLFTLLQPLPVRVDVKLAVSKLRVQDEQGRASVEQVCRQLHAVLQESRNVNVSMLAKVLRIFSAFSETIPRFSSVAETSDTTTEY